MRHRHHDHALALEGAGQVADNADRVAALEPAVEVRRPAVADGADQQLAQPHTTCQRWQPLERLRQAATHRFSLRSPVKLLTPRQQSLPCLLQRKLKESDRRRDRRELVGEKREHRIRRGPGPVRVLDADDQRTARYRDLLLGRAPGRDRLGRRRIGDEENTERELGLQLGFQHRTPYLLVVSSRITVCLAGSG